MNIAICDDNKTDMDLLVDYCHRYNGNLHIFTYISARELLEAYSSVNLDIVFLDIEMEHPNGYEAALQLSHEASPPIIVFTTQTLNYAVRGYGLALRYLPKPITYEMFHPVLHLAIEQRRPSTICIGSESAIEILTVSDISYIEVIQHQVIVHRLSNPDISLRGSFSSILKKLPVDCFVQTHKSFCVNLQHVMRVEPNSLFLCDSSQIPIGRNYKQQLKAQLFAFLRGSD